MGDILSLIERAQETTTEEDAVELQERMLDGQFNLEDFLEQLQEGQADGAAQPALEMIPDSVPRCGRRRRRSPTTTGKRVEAIIYPTSDERRNPDVIGRRRTVRIAKEAAPRSRR